MKKRVVSVVLFVMAFAGCVVGPAGPAFGCSCIEVRVEDAIRADSVAAFVGTAVSVVENADAGRLIGEAYVQPLTWTFEVETVLAGDVPALVEVGSGYGGGDCGYDFTNRGRVGVVAYGNGGQLTTDGCGGVWDADALLASHGPGIDPIAVTDVAAIEFVDTGPPAWFWPGLGAVGIVVIGFAVAGRRRRSYHDGWTAESSD